MDNSQLGNPPALAGILIVSEKPGIIYRIAPHAGVEFSVAAGQLIPYQPHAAKTHR